MVFDRPGCKLVRGEPFKARVWAFFVVINPPCLDDPASLGQRAKQRLVEQLVSEPAIKALDEANMS